MAAYGDIISTSIFPGAITTDAINYANWIAGVNSSSSYSYTLPSADALLLANGMSPVSGLTVRPGDMWKRYVVNQRDAKIVIAPGDCGTGGAGCPSNTQGNCLTVFCIMWLTASQNGNNPPTGTYTVFGGDAVTARTAVSEIKEAVNNVGSQAATSPVLASMGNLDIDDDYILPAATRKADGNADSKE